MIPNSYQNKLKKVTKTQQLLLALLVFVIACGFCLVGFGGATTAMAKYANTAEQLVPSGYTEIDYDVVGSSFRFITYNTKVIVLVLRNDVTNNYCSFEYRPNGLGEDGYCYFDEKGDAWQDHWSVTKERVQTPQGAEPYYVVTITKSTSGDDTNYNFSTLRIFDKEPVVNDTVALPDDPIKEGYTFNGWYLDNACTIPYDNRPIFENITLYAKFTINSYTVTYWVNGDIDSTSTVVYNNKATAKTITAVGKSFSGWYKDIACTQAFDFDTNLITTDTNLYSKLDIIKVNVNFMLGETLYKTVIVNYGTVFVDVSNASACCDTLQNFQIYNVSTNSFIPVTDDTIITSDSVVSAELYDGLGGWLNMGLWLIKNWIWLLVGVSCAIVAVVIFVVVYKKS